jgi:hypothetical protein
MSLEFNQIIEQVYRMGAMLTNLDFDISDKMSQAWELFRDADMNDVWERIDWIRQPDISGYRGAAPLRLPNSEPINARIDEPKAPDRATVLAADGGQVYPDEQGSVHYYLLNIGLFVFHHGIDKTPEPYSYPELKYHKSDVHDRYGRLIRNRTVDDRRTVEEMRRLAAEAWERRNTKDPLIALYDNRLLFIPGNDAYDSDSLLSAYMGALVHMHDSGATLAGYIDNPHRSKRVIQLLYLLTFNSFEEMKQRQEELSTAGFLDGLRDEVFYDAILEPGQRSAIMVQNSPQNKLFRDKGVNYEVAFFYLKVHNGYQAKIVRVDIPVWVARDSARVDALHSMILHQCRMQGRNPYPYAITRADELAWIGGKDRAKLDELINVQVRRVKEELIGSTLPSKARTKELARSDKRYHTMQKWGDIDDK